MINLTDIKVPKEWIIDVRSLKQMDVPCNLTTIVGIHETPHEARISFADNRPLNSPPSSIQSSHKNPTLPHTGSTLSHKSLLACSHNDAIPNPASSLFRTVCN